MPYDITTPPSPIPDCQACADFAALRHDARARGDGTAETDANVLLRRHQHRDHDALRHRRIFRFVPYAIVPDPGAEPGTRPVASPATRTTAAPRPDRAATRRP
ncbi:hypothetical protein ACRAWF_38880 [Streptomyces sp. L7]